MRAADASASHHGIIGNLAPGQDSAGLRYQNLKIFGQACQGQSSSPPSGFSNDLVQQTRQFVDGLKNYFLLELQDCRQAARFGRFVQELLNPARRKAGRKRRSDITDATDLHQRNRKMTWEEITKTVIPGYEGLTDGDKKYQQDRIRRGAGRRIDLDKSRRGRPAGEGQVPV